MAIRLEHCVGYTMRPGVFIWGFSPDGRTEAVARHEQADTIENHRARNLAAQLLKRLHSVGWDIPGLDVHLSAYDGNERGLYRYVSGVSGTHGGKPFRISFNGDAKPELPLTLDEDGEPRVGGYVPGTFGRFEFDRETLEIESRNWSDELRDQFEDIVMTCMSMTSGMAVSPGAFDIDENGDANIRSAFSVDPVPAPSDFPVLYSWVPMDELRRRPEGVILSATGCGLCSDTRPSDIPLLPKRYYDAFDYASDDIAVKADQGMHTVKDASIPVEVRLKNLNEIYVMDMGAKDDARARVEAAIRADGRKQGSRDEFCEVQTAAPKTMVPASEYRGGFRKPVYVIGRHIMSDEARFLQGDVRMAYENERFVVDMVDEISGQRACFISNQYAGPATINDMKRTADWISRCVQRDFVVEPSVEDEMAARRDRARAAAEGPSMHP